jgi:D-amino-acid dehydrogenase
VGAERGNLLLREGGLDRHAVTPAEMRGIEPTLTGDYYGGFFTPSDSTGDIHKFTRGLAEACVRLGALLRVDTAVTEISSGPAGPVVGLAHAQTQAPLGNLSADAVIVCAGVGSRAAAPMVNLLDDPAKIVTSRLGVDRFRVAGTAEFNGFNRDIRADRIAPLVRWCDACFPA